MKTSTSTVQLIFTPDGNGRCLYAEVIDLAGIGPLTLRRATTIEFDDRRQCWIVRDLDGRRLFKNPSRHVCLDWERRHLEHQEHLKHEGKHAHSEKDNDSDNDNDKNTTTKQGAEHA